MTNDERPDGLLAWQWNLYPDNHADRRNLLIHIFANPMFLFGNLLVISAPFTHWTSAVSGLVSTAVAMILQGRGHRLEKVEPKPFHGPLDVLKRIVVEQWITFPRYVISGKFAAAWRAGAPAP